MLRSFVIVTLICAFAPMVIGESSNTFKAAVYEHAVHLPNISVVPMPRNQAVQAMMVNIRVYQETARIAASMVSNTFLNKSDLIVVNTCSRCVVVFRRNCLVNLYKLT